MSIAFLGANSASTNGATSLAIPSFSAGAAVGDLFIVALGFEGRASGSGPWVQPWTGGDPSDVIGEGTDWKQILYQAPSATGCGLEVWAAVILGAGGGAPVTAKFTGSYAAVGVSLGFSGIYGSHILDGTVRIGTSDQWTGDDPEAPSVYAYTGEMLVALATEQMSSPGFGDPTPAGWVSRVDKARANTFGNVEVTAASRPVNSEGATGAIPWNATSAGGADKGATATLAIRPTPPASSTPLILVEYAVPT